MTLHDDLVAAGLGSLIVGTAVAGTTVLWTRPLTAQEEELADGIINPAKGAKKARKAAAIASISGLVGQNISSVNNNAERDALLFAICYLLGICDQNGLILAEPVESIVVLSKKKK